MSTLISWKRTRNFHFGTQWSLNVAGYAILEFIRHPEYAEIRFFHRRLLKWSCPIDTTRDIFNNSNDFQNFQPRQKTNTPRILYIIEGLGRKGGIETRLEKQFSYLIENKKAMPFLMARQIDCAAMIRLKPILLDFRAPNTLSKILSLIVAHEIDVVEFQIDPEKFLPYDCLDSIRNCRPNHPIRIGLCLHSATYQAAKCLPYVDYSLVVTGALHHCSDFASSVFVPNWIRHVQKVWTFHDQTNALLVSRIDKEKLPTVIAFVEICKQLGINFHIAGDCTENEQWVRAVIDQTGIDIRPNLIGLIETMNYLKQNADKYIFVAGVGQVVLEAASLGFPALILSHIKPKFSSFVTRNNLNYFASWNFVIRYCPINKKLGGFSECFERIKRGDTDDFDVVDELNDTLHETKSMKLYLDTVFASQEVSET